MTIYSSHPSTFLVASLFLSSLLLLLLSLVAALVRSRHRRRREELGLEPELIDPAGEGEPPGDAQPGRFPEGEEERKGKKKKRGGKRKKQDSDSRGGDEREQILMVLKAVMGKIGDGGEEDCMYPFSSSSSVTQRRIKQQYDLLVESNAAKALTLAQVGQFANCLMDARNELQHKSEVIKRKFTITKALLFKADRSTFRRLSQQVCKLETEQKRLEEDALVYNRLQEQLKLSPAFQTMLELGTHMETSMSPEQESAIDDSEISDISFEDFLAQEKKDSFWQKNGKLRTCTG